MKKAESNEIGRESCAEAKVISFCHTCGARPMYIAFGDKGELIVTEYQNKIMCVTATMAECRCLTPT